MPRHTYSKNSIEGNKIGLLYVDYKTKMKQDNLPVYMCTCDCGNKTLMISTLIKRYESCGCNKSNKSSYLVIKGDSVVREAEFKAKGEF